jgi:hypothetical protein
MNSFLIIRVICVQLRLHFYCELDLATTEYHMKRPECVLFVLAVPLITVLGCSSVFVNPRAVSMQDVMYLTQHQLGPDVIIAQLNATDSRFALTTEDIVKLKDAGVDERVIETMVERSGAQASAGEQIILPPAASYGPLDQPLLSPYNYYYFPLNDSYFGYYNYPYYLSERQSGLIGRFYNYGLPYYAPPAPTAIPEGNRRSDTGNARTSQDSTSSGRAEK